jgi:hypothetical protein
MRPPLNLVDLIEVNIDFLAGRGGGSLKSPRGFVDEDSVGEVALNQEMRNKISRRSFIGGPYPMWCHRSPGGLVNRQAVPR